MTKVFDRRFSPVAAAWCLRLLGAALIWLAAQELAYGHLDVSRGRLWAWRWDVLPLLPPALRLALWAAQAAAGAALIAGRRTRPAIRVAAAVTLVSLTQAYFNQKAFLALTLAALALDPPDPRAAGFAEASQPALALAGGQLLLLYIVSAAFKLRAGFCDGESLVALFSVLRARGLSGVLSARAMLAWLAAAPERAAWLSRAVVAAEAVLPALLWRRPAEGAAAAVVLHLSFALWMPALWPFTLTCAALALLFLPASTTGPRFARIGL